MSDTIKTGTTQSAFMAHNRCGGSHGLAWRDRNGDVAVVNCPGCIDCGVVEEPGEEPAPAAGAEGAK